MGVGLAPSCSRTCVPRLDCVAGFVVQVTIAWGVLTRIIVVFVLLVACLVSRRAADQCQTNPQCP